AIVGHECFVCRPCFAVFKRLYSIGLQHRRCGQQPNKGVLGGPAEADAVWGRLNVQPLSSGGMMRMSGKRQGQPEIRVRKLHDAISSPAPTESRRLVWGTCPPNGDNGEAGVSHGLDGRIPGVSWMKAL